MIPFVLVIKGFSQHHPPAWSSILIRLPELCNGGAVTSLKYYLNILTPRSHKSIPSVSFVPASHQVSLARHYQPNWVPKFTFRFYLKLWCAMIEWGVKSLWQNGKDRLCILCRMLPTQDIAPHIILLHFYMACCFYLKSTGPWKINFLYGMSQST